MGAARTLLGQMGVMVQKMMETVVDYMFRNLFPYQISCRSESSKLKLGRIREYIKTTLMPSKLCSDIFVSICKNAKDDPKLWLQYVLDCSALPSIIAASQQDNSVLPLMFKATRTYCYSLHRTRLKLFGRWSP